MLPTLWLMVVVSYGHLSSLFHLLTRLLLSLTSVVHLELLWYLKFQPAVTVVELLEVWVEALRTSVFFVVKVLLNCL